EQVDDRDADAHRLPARLAVGLAGDAHQPAHALDDIIVSGAVGVRPILPESGYRSDDQARVDPAKRVRIEPELGEASDLEILHDNVRFLREAADQLCAFF